MATAKSPLFLVHEKMWNVFQSFPMEERLRQVRVFLAHARIPRSIMLRICMLHEHGMKNKEFRDFLDGKKTLEKCHEGKVFTTYLNMKYDPKAIVAYLKINGHLASYF